MPDLSRHTRTTLAVTLLAAAMLITACGGDDKKDSTEPVAANNTPGTTDTTATTKTTPTGPTVEGAPVKPKAPQAKVIKLSAPPRSLKAGGLKVEVKVDSLIDPVTADVDEPQPGGRFVGVFLNTRASGSYEPSKVTAIASLSTKSGKSYPVRVISGGECEGAFFPAGLVLKSKKTRTGCIGFDIPKSETPKEIVLGVRSTVSNAHDTATWDLPEAK